MPTQFFYHMKKKLPYYFLGLLALTGFSLHAQEYQQMPIASGLNADVIANGTGTAVSSTSIDIDGVNYNYVATDYKLTPTSTPITYGVPVNGLINSIATATPGLSFQLASLSANNSLRLSSTTPSGTIVFTTPKAVQTLYMLSVTGSGAGTVSVLVTFTDGTTQNFTGISVPDWYDATNPPPAIQGIGRINRNTNALESSANNPRMYQVPLAISTANQSKLVEEVHITRTSTGTGIVNVFAFSASVTPACPSPTGLSAVSSPTGGTVNWTAASATPSAGYDYYISTTNTTPTASTTPTGNVTNTQTSTSFTGLPTGVQHYVWIRSNCGGTTGSWVQTTFTTGQITATYTAGDLSSLYNTTPTTSSTTTCPATLSITVPAGYQVASANVVYNMTAQAGAWMSEQRSLIRCITTGTSEAAVAQTSEDLDQGGTNIYNRALTIANGAAGTVQFEMRAWRTWGGSDCNTTYNKIDNNTWKITVTYAPIPCTGPLAAPTVVDQAACPATTMGELVISGVPGAYFNWYTTPTGGTPVATTALATAGTYYVAQATGSTCESPRVEVEVTINNVPLPTAAAQTHCSTDTVADLEATGQTGATFKWYTAATGGTALESDTVLIAGTYYVSQVVGGCEGLRTSSAVTLNTTPAPAAEPQTLCLGGTIADLELSTATGPVKWYSLPVGGNELPGTLLVTNYTYYATQTLNGCESARTPIPVTAILTPPPGITPQTVCTGATISELVVVPVFGATVNWYQGTTPIDESHVIGEGPYFVTQSLSGCESSPPTPVTIIMNIVPAPEAGEEQVFCTVSTVADLTAMPVEDGEIHWYATVDSEEPLTDDTAIATGSYFVSQTFEGCESERTEIAVMVTTSPVGAPVIEPAYTACGGSTLADLPVTLADGGTANWYATADSTEPLDAESEVEAVSYFVSQTVDGCESVRTEVAVTVNTIPVPVTEVATTLCEGSTIEDLFITTETGATVNWYLTADGTTPLTAETQLESGVYYASQTLNGCESERNDTEVVINDAPNAPTGNATQEFTAGQTVADLEIVLATGAEANWYIMNDEEEFVSIPDTTELVDGTMYYVRQTLNGCESLSYITIIAEEALSTIQFEKNGFSVYPNPTDADITVTANENISEIAIYTLLGQKVIDQKTNGLTAKVNVSALSEGNYILQITTENGKTNTAKIVKR